MKRANGMGTIIKLTGNRRKPWAIRRVIGWKEDGRPKIKYQGYYRTRREAEIALNEYNADPYTISNMTFADLYNEWYAIQEHEKSAGTLRCYRARYNHLKDIHDEKLSNIDVFMLERLYESLDVTSGVLHDMQILISLMFNYAVKRHYLPITALNIGKAINIPIKEEKRRRPRRVISKDDIDMLWKEKDRNEYAKIILVYIYTGLRFSELHDLDISDCHDNYIDVKRSKTEAGVRIVPICDKLKEVLPIMPVPPLSTFTRYFRMLLPDHTIHDTRHTFISMMTDKGIDVRIIKAIVGHKMDDVTAVYTHISLETMLDAVNKL